MDPNEIILDKTPPYSLEAEKFFLGAILLDSEAITRVIDLLIRRIFIFMRTKIFTVL